MQPLVETLSSYIYIWFTAMRTKAAPPYINLVMGRREKTIREAFIWTILFWKRFIDDIFLIS